MPIVLLQQTDTASVDAIAGACSGRLAGGVTTSKQATRGGAAGSSTPSITVPTGTTKLYVWFETAASECDNYSCPAGTWSVPLNITSATTGGADTVGQTCYICRLNSSGVSQQTIGSASAAGVNPGVTGVYTVNVSGSSATFSTGDRVCIIFEFGSPSIAGTFQITPNQVITTPMSYQGAQTMSGGANFTPYSVKNLVFGY